MMKPKYKVIEMPDYSYVERTDPNGKIWAIPMDKANSDYQAYLRWLENPDAEENGTIS
jgi:hypothetical protein